jgi:hypothetical protein
MKMGDSATNSEHAVFGAYQVTGERDVVGLVDAGSGSIVAANVPGGSRVMFVGDAVTMPSASAATETPVDGFVLASQSGQPFFKLGSGSSTAGATVRIEGAILAGAPTWGAVGTQTIPLASVQRPNAYLSVFINGTAHRIPAYLP